MSWTLFASPLSATVSGAGPPIPPPETLSACTLLCAVPDAGSDGRCADVPMIWSGSLSLPEPLAVHVWITIAAAAWWARPVAGFDVGGSRAGHRCHCTLPPARPPARSRTNSPLLSSASLSSLLPSAWKVWSQDEAVERRALPAQWPAATCVYIWEIASLKWLIYKAVVWYDHHWSNLHD